MTALSSSTNDHFTSQLVTRNSQPFPPGSKKLAVDFKLLEKSFSIIYNPGMNKRQTKSGLFIQSCMLVSFFWLISSCLNAQNENIRFKHISIEEGLSEVTVNCICQDHKKFMWFGTQDGLNRYDGYKFKIYRNDPEKKNTISDNYIWDICEDNYGILWIGTNGGGLNRFDRKTKQFIQYKQNSDNPNDPQSISHNEVRCIHEDQFERLWIGTEGGLDVFDRKTGNFIHYRHKEDNQNSLSDNNIWCIYEDKFRMLWIGTEEGGLNKFDRKSNCFIRYMHHPDVTQTINTCGFTVV